jgi:putative oxidoreductase
MQRVEKYFFLLLRVYLGTFNFASGVNYFVRVWPQPIPADPLNATYMSVTLHMGMFQLAKVIETIGGLCLIADLWVPFALVLLFPITVTVFILDSFFSPLAHVVVSGARNFTFHVLLFAAYARYYLSLLTPSARLAPLWRSVPPPCEEPSGVLKSSPGVIRHV